MVKHKTIITDNGLRYACNKTKNISLSKCAKRKYQVTCKNCLKTFKKYRRPTKKCKECGLYKSHKGRGLCNACYSRWLRRKNKILINV